MDLIKQGTVNGQPVIQCYSRLYTDLETLLSGHAIIQRRFSFPPYNFFQSLVLFLNIVKGATKTLQVSPARSLIDCPDGEHLKICRSSCEPLCYKQEVKCKTICSTAKCVCMEGFVRHNGVCIPKHACQLFGTKIQPELDVKAKGVSPIVPTPVVMATLPPEVIVNPEAPPPKCGRNQVYSSCVCDSTCQVEKKCSSCSSGCGCFPLYVRHNKGYCIPKRKCFKKPATFKRPSPTLKFAVITSAEGPLPPPLILTTTTKPTKELTSRSNLRGPPAITPFTFYRHKRIERKKNALRKLLKLM